MPGTHTVLCSRTVFGLAGPPRTKGQSIPPFDYNLGAYALPQNILKCTYFLRPVEHISPTFDRNHTSWAGQEALIGTISQYHTQLIFGVWI